MIIDFTFSNFRSFRDQVEFTMVADSSKSKADNTFEQHYNQDRSIQLLKTAAVYGANASGKSNFIRAFQAFTYLINRSAKFSLDIPRIPVYEPFELDPRTQNGPVGFKITFLLNNIKYEYEIAYEKKQIASEKLNYYPQGYISNLFNRNISDNSNFDTIALGNSLPDRKILNRVFKTQLYLSKFGIEIPHETLTPVFEYLKNIEVWNTSNKFKITDLSNELSYLIAQPENAHLKERLSKLIKISDTRIDSIKAKELKKEDFLIPSEIPEDIATEFYEMNKIRTFTTHKVYRDSKEVGQIDFDLNRKESMGTKVLFALGGKILQILEKGGILIVDELDNSLHPLLCKFLIQLFQSKVSNPKNAQLIFATHEVTLLDHDLFRKDQIWFVQKDKFGNSELYKAGDFEGVRDSTNFEVWYRAGKFGGNPKIKEVKFIYE